MALTKHETPFFFLDFYSKFTWYVGISPLSNCLVLFDLKGGLFCVVTKKYPNQLEQRIKIFGMRIFIENKKLY